MKHRLRRAASPITLDSGVPNRLSRCVKIHSLGTYGEVSLSRAADKVEESPHLSTPGIFDKADPGLRR